VSLKGIDESKRAGTAGHVPQCARCGSLLPPLHCPGRTSLASRPDNRPDRAVLPPRPTPVCCDAVRSSLNTPDASGPNTRAPAGAQQQRKRVCLPAAERLQPSWPASSGGTSASTAVLPLVHMTHMYTAHVHRGVSAVAAEEGGHPFLCRRLAHLSGCWGWPGLSAALCPQCRRVPGHLQGSWLACTHKHRPHINRTPIA
jgi:hypothetical protein